MIREIGSEFWNVPTGEDNNLFPMDTKWFISGRSAQQAIIEDIKKKQNIRTVAIPDWCCDSMIIPFINKNIKIEYYPAMQPIQYTGTDAILVMDYFGYSGHGNVGNHKGVVIRDVTHTILSRIYNDADYYFGSLRKWAGFWTGGYACGFKEEVNYEFDDLGYVALREMAMQEKSIYINGKSDSKDYLRTFDKAEKILEKLGILPAAERDMEQAKKLDVTFIKERRRKNAQILLSAISDCALFPELNDNDCPMFVPIKIKNRNELRRHLIQNGIYCPIHWPKSQYHRLSKEAEKLYDEELSLVCDHRYTEEDMYRIINIIKNYKRVEASC